MKDEERYAKGMQTRREVLGDAHVDRAEANKTPFNEDFQSFITRVAWGDVWQREGLSRRDRSLVTLSLLIALNREDEFQMHVRAALNNGVTKDEIRELMLHAAIYAGMPASNSAYRAAWAVLAETD